MVKVSYNGDIYWTESPTQKYTRDYLALVAAGLAMGLDENEIDEFVNRTTNVTSYMAPSEMYKYLIKKAYMIRSKRK